MTWDYRQPHDSGWGNEQSCTQWSLMYGRSQQWEGRHNLFLDNLRLHPAIDLLCELHLTPVEILYMKQWQDVSGNVTASQGLKHIVHKTHGIFTCCPPNKTKLKISREIPYLSNSIGIYLKRKNNFSFFVGRSF